MLRTFVARWQRWLDRADIKQQVEEELRFHCEMLIQEYRERGLSEDAARAASRRRFGEVKPIQAQCVRISMRNRPAIKLLKLFLLISFTTGVWLRVRGLEFQVMHMGNVLMAIAVLGQLLLDLQGLRSTEPLSVERGSRVSPPGQDGSSPNGGCDELRRTPVERLLADKRS